MTEPYQLFPVIDWLASELTDQLADRVAYRLQLTAQAAGLAFSGSRLSKLPLHDARTITHQAQLALQDSGVSGLWVEQLPLELAGVVREATQLSLLQQRAQLSHAVKVVSERFAGSLFIYQEVNSYMPITEVQFRKQFLGQEGGGDEAAQNRGHQPERHAHTRGRSARGTAHRQLSSVA